MKSTEQHYREYGIEQDNRTPFTWAAVRIAPLLQKWKYTPWIVGIVSFYLPIFAPDFVLGRPWIWIWESNAFLSAFDPGFWLTEVNWWLDHGWILGAYLLFCAVCIVLLEASLLVGFQQPGEQPTTNHEPRQ